ncbi:hypothetical protein [Carboxylicivirga marina]|uniref:Uncharacterized protein n=1 Tax=Carboxylicivirga marina TaxID=2800988 RepID=A0ABS1HQZ4_9BACT|nr:hypothetical protein [Carboxylicivirga marina]MBK3519589.1 hypothetical protein [Carboxylicivirga marina]
MRKVSAHYYLRPDGSFGKRPIIEMNDDGCISGVRELGNDFQEEPSLEYYPGILIPAFVASVQTGENLSFAKANGVLRIKEGDSTLDKQSFLQAWNFIKSTLLQQGNSETLSCLLSNHTFEAARQINMNEWGVIQEGANPGLLVLQHIDLRSFSVMEKSTFKIIQR